MEPFRATRMMGVALVVYGAAGCAAVDDAPLVQRPRAELVIGVLELADRSVSIVSAEDGVRYGVNDREGRWLATLTLEELESRDPELFEIAKAATAGQSAVLGGSMLGGSIVGGSIVGGSMLGGSVLDARLDGPPASMSALPGAAVHADRFGRRH